MPRLIDADALLALVKKNVPYIYHMVALVVAMIPTIDAEPVRHGRWSDDQYRYKCEGCGKWVLLEDGTADMNYCPECGRKMDGGKEDAK